MVIHDVGEALATTWFTAGLSADSRARLTALGLLTEVAKGETVVREGTPCASLGIVVTGRIALRLRLPGAEDRTILTVEPGDVFGWSAILPPAIATSTGIAVLPTTVVLFDGARLTAALDADPELAAIVYRRLLAIVARRLGATRLQLLDLYRAGGEPW
jgi:CRP/FNR family transcriptional regulator, cyclic AMP receptor protein